MGSEMCIRDSYRYTGKVLIIEGVQPALGAGGREFESFHPDSATIPLVSYKALGKTGAFFYHIYSYLIKYIPKSDTPITDTALISLTPTHCRVIISPISTTDTLVKFYL